MPQSYTSPAHPLLGPMVGVSDDVDSWLQAMEADLASPGEGGPMLTAPRLQAMRDFFKDPVQDLTSTAKRIDAWKPTQSYMPPNYMFWQAVADAAKKLPSHHDRLLDLIVAIHCLAPKDTKESMGFNQVFGQFQGWRSTGTQESVNKSAVTAFLAEVFMAKLTLRGLSASADDQPAVKHLSTWLDKGALAVRSVLENTAWDPESVTFAFAEGDGETYEIPMGSDDEDDTEADDSAGRHQDEETFQAYKSVQALNYSILFVEPWINMCRGELHKVCRAGGTFPCDVPGQNIPTNFGIGKGYCMARWEFWRARLHEISGTEELDLHTKKIAQDCLQMMTKAEE